MSEWISVEERLPYIGCKVLFVTHGRMTVGHTTISKNNRNEKTSSYCWHGVGGFIVSARDVTHWMPLPEPPELERPPEMPELPAVPETTHMIRRENHQIRAGDMPTRRAKPLTGPRFVLPDSISAACAKAPAGRWHNCTMLRCACKCHERAGK